MAQFEITTNEITTYQDLGSHIRSLVEEAPESQALTHLIRGEEEGASVSYGQLDGMARSLASLFQSKKAQGERALMLFNAGIAPVAAFLGCLYGRVIAVPLPAPEGARIHRYMPRVAAVVRNADIRFVLTTIDILRSLQEATQGLPAFRNIEWITVDALPEMSHEWTEETVEEGDLAYLQYSSGSTSTPKGIMITHGNLRKICEYDGAMLNFSKRDGRAICWTPYFHDYGLIEGLMVPLYHGLPIYIMSPFDFVSKPLRWLNAIHRYRATNSSGPNFAYELCVRKTTPEQRMALDLSCWRTASCGGEPISSVTVESFLAAFAPCGFRPEAFHPIWGLAEATLAVTGRSGATFHRLIGAKLEQNVVEYGSDAGPVRTMVGCGKVLKNTGDMEIQIVDPVTRLPAPVGTVGEVWVRGELVAQGYWERPADTGELFHAQIAGGNGDHFLRTGDLGFMAGDEFVFTGRYKDLIIVEGKNHYPQDIEKTVEGSHSALRPGCSIAFSVETDADVRVVVVVELSKEIRIGEAGSDVSRRYVPRKEIEKAIRSEVAEEHQIRITDIVLIAPNTIPKTSSGKVQRNACRQLFLSGTLTPAN